MKILIFGGTTEGRLLAEKLCQRGAEVCVSCATELGGEELREIPCKISCKRRNAEEIADLMGEYDLVVDATHPYSGEVSGNIRKAAAVSGKTLRRIIRRQEKTGNCQYAVSCAEAAELLSAEAGNILIATGSKELSDYACLPPERLYPRILPTHDGLSACESMQIPHSHIIAIQGPFSRKMNEAVLEQFHIRWMVTRESGAAGGFLEKMEAAQALGVKVILVQRPEEQGMSMEEFLNEVDALWK